MAAVTSPPVYFIRHGQTDWNLQGLIQGWTDTPLNETGHGQAKAVARALANLSELASGYRYVVSPLQRTRQTMAHIARTLSLAERHIAVEPNVKELGFGEWEGKPFWELKASPVYPADAETRYAWRPKGGESYEDGHARLKSWMDRVSEPVVVVAHGAIGRCLIGHLTSMPRAEVVKLVMPQGQFCRIHHGRAEWFDAMAQAA